MADILKYTCPHCQNTIREPIISIKTSEVCWEEEVCMPGLIPIRLFQEVEVSETDQSGLYAIGSDEPGKTTLACPWCGWRVISPGKTLKMLEGKYGSD